MGKLKKIFFSFMVLFFIQVNYGYLYPANGWPTSFTYHYGNAENLIENMFEDEKVSKWFNRGYNPDDRYSPINKENKRRILEQLKKISDKAVFDAIAQVKNCSDFNKLFEKNASKNLSSMKNRVTFTPNIPGDGYGTVGNYGIFVKDLYLKYFLYHMGKQAREIENGQRTDFDLTPDHFDYGWGGKAGMSIKITVPHELIHFASGFNGGGRESECIVHCLTKKCIDSNHDFKDVEVETIINWSRKIVPISCHKIEEKFWKGKKDIADEMEAGDCFCGIKWVENAKCDEPILTAASTAGKKIERDKPDDHYSFAAGINYITNILSTTVFDFPIEGKRNFISFNFYPNILIYEKYFGDIQNLLNKYSEFYISDYVHDYFSNNHKILFIGSGELIGDEKSAIIKQALENFVANGGVLFAQTQQYGTQIEALVPIPENESLRFIGFRQDQSCVRNSGYFRSIHPAVSSSTTELLDMGLDGYFPVYPSGSTVLLRRRISEEPALLYYPYKNGWVILGANFTDYSLSKSMASTAELKITRDLLAFAKNPDLPILMVDLEKEPIPTITRDVTLRNPTGDTAVKAILKVYTPDKDQVLYETQENITLNPGDHGEIPVTFSLTGVTPDMYGIWHVFYELYNSDNDLIFLEESEAGRFALYKITTPYTSNQPISAWITVQDELLYFSEPAAFEFHLKNNSTESKTLDLKYSWNHELFKTDLQTITIPAGEQVDLQFDINAPPIAHYVSAYRGHKAEMLFRLWYGPTQTNQFNQATKGIQFMTPKTESSIVQIQPDKIPVGKPFSYKIKVNNESDTEIVDAAIAVTLEKLEWPENNYVQVSQLYETLHTFTAGETFSYNGNYTPTTPHESGMYRLKMAVQKPEGTREENYGHFLYINSNIGVSVEPLIDTDLVAGTTYPVKIMLAKKSFFDVLNGRYSILFKTPDGQTACRKDVENLVLTGYRSIPIEDAVTFTPTILAPYYRLVVEYSDETILTPRVTDSGKRYPFKYSAALALDKEVYLYRETANVSLKIEGAGTFDVHFTCAGAGIDEQRVVIVPAGSVGTVEIFPVPIGLENYYNARFAITCREGFYSTFGGQLSIPIPKLPLQLEANGTFGHISANVGTPIDFNLTVTGISGFTAPLPGQLKVSCMNYTDVQNVTLLPIEDNNFSYHIPVEESLNAGTYHAFVSFSHEGRLLISKNFPIKIPGPDIKFAEPPAQLNAGDSFVLSLENPGGKNGEYQWEVYLKDQKGNSILEYTSTNNFPINAGQKKEITLEIPGDAASGPYILLQKAKETNIEKEAVHYSGHQVTGVYITLNTYTLKEKYFANEPVSGKAEITSGSGDMENGQLQSGIVRFIESQGIEEQKSGEFIAYNMIESGFSSGTMLYLVADKGVLAYDVVSGTVDVRYSFDDSTGFNSKDLLLSSAGELWIASTYGIWKQTSGSQWEHYTTADGLANNWIYDIMEVIGMSGSEIWAATSGGISVFRGGQWVNYTTADGLPANRVYRLTVDGSGAIWASSSEGVVKFNGTTFESVEAPFGTTSVSEKITGTSDGSVWMATSTQLYQYQPGSTMWNEWNLTDLYPASSVSVHDMETVNGDLWMKTRARDAEGNLFNVLIHFDSGFSYYTALETPGLTGLDYAPIIPGSSDSGDSAYFICEIGAMEFRADAWTHRVIDIDGNKFCGDIQCLAADSLGRLWAGTDFGFSMYDGSQWTNYYSTTGNQLIMDIMLMDVDTQNRVYGYCSPLGGILRLYDGNTELISFPYSLGYYPQYDDKMAVDTQGRIWLGRKDLYYYDGQWHKYDGVRYVKCMIKDFNGGVWLGSRTSPNDTAGAEFHLLHIKNDFTFDDYTASNSELIPWEKDRLYLDQNGTLWIKNYAYNYSDKRSLQSFDGSNWIDYSNFTGFPALGAQDFVNNHNDQLHMVEPDGALYVLKNNEFVMEMEQTYYSHSLIWWNERLRCVGYTDDNGGGGGEVPTVAAGLTALTSYNNLLTLSGASGLMEEELWSRTYPVTLDTVDLITGKTFPPGTYELKTALMSPLQQKLANSQYNFVVKDTGLSTTLLADGLNSGFLKPDTDLGITMEVLNNTPETKSNLDFTLKKISPSGTEEMMISENFTLTPGQLEPRSVNFNESEVGIWKLTASLQDYSTGEEKKSSLLIGVTGPEVTMEVLAPEYVGDENFDVKLRLSNQGNINAQLNVQVSAGGETPLDEPLTLRPREERILTINDTISADKTYTIALSGDIEKTETKTVKYGYVENFSINIPPAYREGQVSIGYTIANGGGLAFTDQVSFELFAVGGTLPLYTTERNYSLYPDQAPIMDTIDISLLPGNYQLNYHTSKQPQVQTALLVVQPSGIGNIAIKPSGQYPVGAADITYSITNIDTFAGQVPVTLTLTGGEPGTPLLTETRDYYLLAGETRNDVFHYEFASPGDYTLNFTGPKLPAPIHSIIQVKNLKQVTANLSIGPVETDSIPVNVILENSGYQTFTGTAVIEVGDIRHEEIMDVSPGSSFDGTVELNTSVLTPGSKEVKAFLYDNAGNAIAQTTGTVIVQPANIKLKEYPENLEISAGSFGEVTLTLKNEGNLRGEAVLKINTFDTLYQEREVVLEPGEEIQLGDIFIQAPPDLPTGSYPFYYSLKGSGVENSSSAGNFNFKVNGLSLDIDASLDRSLYNPGETAALTLNITAGTASDAPLEAVVNWGIFSETRQFNLSSGSASLVFDIPLDQAREEKVFYGIYHEGGKSFHLNDIYLHFRGEISVETDKQVYAPGEMVHAVFTGEHTGILTVSAFAESYTLDFSSSASAGFQAPIDTLAGTYGIGWSLIPSDPSKPELSGSHPFDVSGLKVKVAKSELEKGKYAPGDTVNAHYVFESNRDQTLKLRNWVVPPSGDWTYLGESSVTVSSQQQVDAVTGYSFSTTEAGTHELVYGLYQAEGCENCDQLVVSGRLSFDVGNAVLLGINTDQWEYQTGDEPVTLKIVYFGEGFSQLQIYLDEENVHQQGLTLSGTGSTGVVLQSSSISGGSHQVKALLIQNNLTSTKSTGFTYGTHLPDLTAWLTDTIEDGLNYSFKIQVTNTGKTTSTASSMLFSDNNMNVGTASIPALPPSQSYEVIFNWNGSGKAGSHELSFEVDNTNTIKEFSETNNSMEFTLEVPALFYSLETDPPDQLIYPANTPINMITRLINNRETPLPLTLDLSITNDDSGVIIHNQIKEEQIPAFGSKIITDTFNTGVYPAGNYTARGALFCQRWQVQVTGEGEDLRNDIKKEASLNRSPMPWGPLDPPQKLFIGEGSDSVDMVRELFLFFKPTKIVSGSLQIQPQQIPAKTPTEVQLTLSLKNAGNVPLEDEILQIDVFNTDLGEVVISEEFSVSIPLAKEINETKTMTLNLVEGNYEIWLKHHEEILSLADLTAISAVKPSQTIGIYPRVLIINLNEKFLRGAGAVFSKRAPAQSMNPVQFLTGLLQSQNIEYEVGHRLLASYVKFHKGQANVNIVLGNAIGRNLRDELKERVWHGEGLILVCNKPAQNHEWIDFLGVIIKPVPGKNRETVIQILPNEFSSAGEVELQGKIRLRMVKHQDDVVIIAQTQQKKYPVITYRKYGKGHILIIMKSFCGGGQGGQFFQKAPPLELFLNAITRFSQDIYTGSDLTRLLPLELSLKNDSSESKTLKIKTFLPYGVEAFDFKPEPEEAEELKWTITIPAVSTETISYWIKLPDQINSFEIKTELYDEETKLDEVSTAFEVTQTVLFRINELILELDMTGAGGKDAQPVRNAKHHLAQIRNRSGDSFMVHLLNLHDSVKAASYLGDVKNVDVSNQRLKTQDIMIIMGRRFYESVKTWTENRLMPFLKIIEPHE